MRMLPMMALFALVATVSAEETVYTWTDKDGVTHYAEQPAEGAEDAEKLDLDEEAPVSTIDTGGLRPSEEEFLQSVDRQNAAAEQQRTTGGDGKPAVIVLNPSDDRVITDGGLLDASEEEGIIRRQQADDTLSSAGVRAGEELDGFTQERDDERQLSNDDSAEDRTHNAQTEDRDGL